MIGEFREFLMRGNIVELAVAFIAGAAFSTVVQSLVSDVVMQLVAAVFGTPDFSGLSFTLRDAEIRVGTFLTAVVNFVLTMAGVFFFLVKPVNALTARIAPADPQGPTSRECTQCLGQVPARARRCRFCTSELTPVA